MLGYDAIIFDLDGTLWDTKDSYLYAYHQVLKNHPEITDIKTDEEVQGTMGLTLDIVGKQIFGDYFNIPQLMAECLQYSCEYLLANPSTIKESVVKTLNKLKNEIKLFIVSNCPKEYIQVFLKKLNDNSIFKDYRYLTPITSKEANIADIINDYSIKKCLMVGDSHIDYEACSSNNIDFAFIDSGYRTAQNYNYKITELSELIDVVDFVKRRDKILRGCYFYKTLNYNDAQLTIMKNKQQNGADYIFGFWRYSSISENNNQLMEALDKYLKANNIKSIVGPVDCCTWFKYRLAVDCFDLKLLPDIDNSREQVDFLLEKGFTKKCEYSSKISSLDYSLWERLKKLKLDSSYSVCIYHNQECFEHIKDIYEISIDCFADAYLYVPITFEDFKELYVDGLKCPNPDVVIIYHRSTPVAFSLCYDDPFNNMYVSKTVGIKKDYQNGALIGKLTCASYECMHKKGYNHVVLHFQNDEKRILPRIYKNSILKQKHYWIFEREV